MDRGGLWRAAFGGNLRLLERNGGDLTEELAGRRPAPDVASAAWLLGHLILTRRRLLELAGAKPVEDPAWSTHYGGGTSGIEAHLAWPALVETFRALDGTLGEAFEILADWDRPTWNPALRVDQPLEQVVAFLFRHECYHLGQLGLARKLYGLPGAI
ncbi:DinB family protein [Geothrix sp. 21YS21S-4]|uniref:DinB family protein n=1 Tax=Geothrix sp. 21YS21S-4 TaxID=3068889 RepID=UPI0027BA9BBC|nr:DinB family protein [Geothrix sp. 21YS21S-4]